jgi:hypothetical protein
MRTSSSASFQRVPFEWSSELGHDTRQERETLGTPGEEMSEDVRNFLLGGLRPQKPLEKLFRDVLRVHDPSLVESSIQGSYCILQASP